MFFSPTRKGWSWCVREVGFGPLASSLLSYLPVETDQPQHWSALVSASVLFIHAISGQPDKSSYDGCPYEPPHTYRVAKCVVYIIPLPQSVGLRLGTRVLVQHINHVLRIGGPSVLSLLLRSIWPLLRTGCNAVGFDRSVAHVWYTSCRQRTPIYMAVMHL